MFRNAVCVAAAALVLGSLFSSQEVHAQPKPRSKEVTYSMTIPIQDLVVYVIEVKSTKPVALRLASPKNIETARVRKTGVPSAMRQKDGSTVYSSKLEYGLSSADLPGDWGLDIIFSDGTPTDEAYTLSITPKFTR